MVNGSAQGERLEPMADVLEALGYPPVRGVAGAVPATSTQIYVTEEGFRSAGVQLAMDIGLAKEDVLLLADGPPVAGLGGAILVLYLGGS